MKDQLELSNQHLVYLFGILIAANVVVGSYVLMKMDTLILLLDLWRYA